MVSSTLLARRFPLRMGEAPDVTQVVTMWEDFAIADEPSPEAGPVAVEIAYRIRPEETAAFLDRLSHLRAPRRRDGATFWRLYRDWPSRRGTSSVSSSRRGPTICTSVRVPPSPTRNWRRGCDRSCSRGEAVTMQHYIAER